MTKHPFGASAGTPIHPLAAVQPRGRTGVLILLWLAIAVMAVAIFVRGAAAESKPLSVAQALSMLQAMRNLDGHIVIVKQNGVDTAITQPWSFGSGSLRVRIATSTAALAEVEKRLDETRRSIVRELLKTLPEVDGKKPTEIPAGTPQWSELQRQFVEALEAPASVTLSRIKASELKLDQNEIPVTAIAALAPILDDDVSPK